jgi:hypothetical protein
LTGARAGYYRPRMSPRHRDELFVIWSAARADANIAYEAWCERHGAEAYLVYRAAEDRADAAERALARASRPAAVLAA